MLKRSFLVLGGVALLVAIIVMMLPQGVSSRLKRTVGGFFLPLFGVTTSVEQGAEKLGDIASPRSVLLRELRELRDANRRLAIENTQLREAWRENGALREQLGLPQQAPWRMRMGKVIGRDPANWWRTIQINLGSRDGLVVDLPVITADGLVGRVSEVGAARSQVVLIGDPNCRVSVLIQETREHGVIAPSGSNPLDPSIVELGYLSRNSILKPDQLVVTSGLGGVFPKGLTVGRILDYRTVDFGLYTEARVKLAANIGALEEVWVVLP